MPPRRPHSKSRLGCKQCKQRRVKCDEKGPSCYNCTRRSFDCSFRYTGAPTRPSSLPDIDNNYGYSHSAPSTPWSPDFLSSNHAHFSRTTELELMHQYSASTFEMFVNRPATDMQRMKFEVPQWALTHQFLLDAIFSLAALHIAWQRPESANRYGDLAIAYQERALTTFREVIRNPRADQCPAMFYTSCFISIVAFSIAGIHPMAKDSGPTATLIHLARLLGGSLAIIETGRELMGAETWNAFLPERPTSTSTVLDPEVMAVLRRLRILAAEADARLAGSPVSTIEHDSPHSKYSPREPTADVFSKAVAVLSEYFVNIVADPHVVLAWLVACGPQFTDRLEDGEPMAQLITLVFAVLMHQIDERWWVNGMASKLVDELKRPVARHCEEWEGIADWVVRRVQGSAPSEVEGGASRLRGGISAAGQEEMLVDQEYGSTVATQPRQQSTGMEASQPWQLYLPKPLKADSYP